MATFSTFHSSITFTAGWSGGYGLTSSTATQLVYDLNGFIATVLTGTAFGIKFNATSSGIELDVEDSDDSGTDPSLFSSNTITTPVSSGIVTVGQSIDILASNGDFRATFVVPDFGYSSGLGTLGVNVPYVTWLFPSRSCGQNTFVSVTNTASTSTAMTYTVHDSTGQVGSILVGTGSTDTANYSFTISAGTMVVKDSSGSSIGAKMFTCSGKKVFSNFW